MNDFTYELGADGVAIITWDVPDKSMNVLSLQGWDELDACIDRLLADDGAKGGIITSGKADFAGGMDLNVIARMKAAAGDTPAKGVFDGLSKVHAILRKIERAGMDAKTNKGGKPIVAALPGTALGIGLEIPLACHRIIAAPNPKAKIGFPEILVGIFPGAGGTTRLSRKLGIMAAAPFLLEGKLLDPARAKAAGLIDDVADDPVAAARDWILAATDAEIVKPWDVKGWKMPGGAPYHPAGYMTFVGASAMVLGNTSGVYPAAKAMLSAAYEGALVPFDTAIRIEQRWFTKILCDPTSTAMIRSLFINKTALEKGAVRPAVPDESVKKLGVLGAGMMGAGIAYVTANAGIEVVLIDSTQQAADRGKSHAAGILDTGIQRKKVTAEKKDQVLARIAPTTDYAALAGCDLVIEAVFEDPGVKAEVTQKAEAVLRDGAIFATNTSTLPITALAKASARPADFIGIHFFSPVDKMALVEIIKGKASGDRAVAKALDFVRQIRKTPIVVNDARFFYANRCIIPYINEGVMMLAEGVAPTLIEHAAQQLGLPVGPLQLNDETSIDLGVKIATATKAAMGDAYPKAAAKADAVLFKLFALGRLGRKSNAGYYDYDDKGRRTQLWPGLAELWPHTAQQPEFTEIQLRLAMVQTLEAVRAFQEGVLTDIREGDVGAILGWGFLPWSGGPFSWLDMLGAPKAVEICDALAAKFGARFTPPTLLRDMAAKGDSFYGRALV